MYKNIMLIALLGIALSSCKTIDHKSEEFSIPVSVSTTALASTVYYPEGTGPFPLVILNHGTPASRAKREEMGRWVQPVPINALIERGFAVMVPIRRGFGATGGEYVAGIGSCDDPDFYFGSLNAGEDIVAAANYAQRLPAVDGNRILLIGHSAGGIASLAAASLKPTGVRAVVNFSGGRGGGSSNRKYGVPCYPERMAEAIKTYAENIKVPVLWYYVENDSFFGPTVVRTWFEAFKEGGGIGKLVIDPAYGSDGHFALTENGSDKHWGPSLDSFLKDYGFPIN